MVIEYVFKHGDIEVSFSTNDPAYAVRVLMVFIRGLGIRNVETRAS